MALKISYWTKEEIEKLKDYKNKKLLTSEISKLLNRTEAAINIKVSELNIKNSNYNFWIKEETDLLIEKYNLLTKEELIKTFSNHSIGSIYKKAKKLGLDKKTFTIENGKITNNDIEIIKKLHQDGYSDRYISDFLNNSITKVTNERRKNFKKYSKWTKEEIDILKEKYINLYIKDLIEFLPNKTKVQIKNKAKKLNLYNTKGLIWKETEIDILIKEYPIKTIEELKEVFPEKTKNQIRKKARRLKLKKTKEVLLKSFKIGRFPSTFTRKTNWRIYILNRDKYCCQLCKQTKEYINLQVHHIKPARHCSKVEFFDVNNGICLCKSCHKKIHGKEYKYIKLFKKYIENFLEVV